MKLLLLLTMLPLLITSSIDGSAANSAHSETTNSTTSAVLTTVTTKLPPTNGSAQETTESTITTDTTTPVSSSSTMNMTDEQTTITTTPDAGNTTNTPDNSTSSDTSTPVSTSTPINNSTASTTSQANNSTDANTTSTAMPPVSSTDSQPNSTTAASSTSSSTAAVTSASTVVTTQSPFASSLISETNILLASDGLFVELKGTASVSLQGLTLAIFNGSSATLIKGISFDSALKYNEEGFFVQPVVKADVQELTSVVVTLFYTKFYNGTLTGNGLLDFAFYTENPSSVDNGISSLIPGATFTVVKSSNSSSQSLSLSRCGEAPKDTSMFVLAPSTKLLSNNCTYVNTLNTTFNLLLHKNKGVCLAPTEDTEANLEALQKQLVEAVNMQCACGMSPLLIQGNLTCAQELLLQFVIKESYNGQSELFLAAFQSYVSGTPTIVVGGQNYTIVNCTMNCRHSDKHLGGGNTSNSTVTVAVVVSCLAVFLILLISVVLYMRGRRKGIIRQFRMTRLQEDDDMEDMDDFIGGGEPSFSSSRNNLTR